jgi:hypothetical protein
MLRTKPDHKDGESGEYLQVLQYLWHEIGNWHSITVLVLYVLVL